MSNHLFMYFLAGTLGVLLQLTVKVNSLKIQGKAANHPFTFKEYLSNDWATILGSFVAVGILIVCLDEFLALKPEVAKFIKWIFVFVGYTGSSIIQALLSVTGRKLTAIIDVKTNIADEVQPPVTSENIEGTKEILKEKDGK